MTFTREDADAAIADVVARYYPAHVKTYEVRYFVLHYLTYGTWLICAAYRTKGPVVRILSRRMHYGSITQELVPLEPVEGHEPGVCVPCTARWRRENGVGPSLDDLALYPSFKRPSQLKASDEQLERELEAMPPVRTP